METLVLAAVVTLWLLLLVLVQIRNHIVTLNKNIIAIGQAAQGQRNVLAGRRADGADL